MRRACPLVRRTWRYAAAAVLGGALRVAAPGLTAYAGEDEQVRPLPTIAILQELAAEAGREIAAGLPGDTASAVVLVVEPADNTWFVDAGFTNGLAPRPVVKEPGPMASHTMSIGVTSMGVAYENVRRDGLFGTRVVTRTAFLEADVSVASRMTGEILRRATVRRTRQDDVRLDDLARLEEPGLSWTTATIPPEGFFSSVLEPVITLGAIAVAVILLFTVRS
jgi:hypothetical protein